MIVVLFGITGAALLIQKKIEKGPQANSKPKKEDGTKPSSNEENQVKEMNHDLSNMEVAFSLREKDKHELLELHRSLKEMDYRIQQIEHEYRRAVGSNFQGKIPQESLYGLEREIQYVKHQAKTLVRQTKELENNREWENLQDLYLQKK